jgi:uncharacterized protein (DUF952 family)
LNWPGAPDTVDRQEQESAYRVVTIYKICPAQVWNEAERSGVFRGTAVDHRDGYIHFSTAAQTPETAAKHFADQDDLVLVAVDAEALGPQLKWEPSRGGALFPHLYADLPVTAVTGVRALVRAPDGRHRFPELAP